jgi:N-acetyl-anhydromuramyl-L-alanine amidase AmpD
MVFADCLLQSANPRPVGSTTLGDLVRDSGAVQLWDARDESGVDTVVVHFISDPAAPPDQMFDEERILAVFPRFGVSSHYLIARSGTVLRLVPEQERAWHCGGSVMPEPDGRTAVNAFSVGVELAGTADSGFTDEQYESLVSVCVAVAGRWGPGLRIVGHEHVAGARAVSMGLRSDVKVDPGPLFDWRRLGALLPGGAVAEVEGLRWGI